MVSLAGDEKNMNIIAMITIVGLVLGMVKKNGKKGGFAWQRTLGGLKAVQWLKPGIEFTPIKLEFGLGEALAKQGFAVSEWNLEKECVVLHEEGAVMPLLIGSRAIANYFGEVAKGWEEAGADGSTQNDIDTITLPKELQRFIYKFDRGDGQFDPYFVVADEVLE